MRIIDNANSASAQWIALHTSGRTHHGRRERRNAISRHTIKHAQHGTQRCIHHVEATKELRRENRTRWEHGEVRSLPEQRKPSSLKVKIDINNAHFGISTNTDGNGTL